MTATSAVNLIQYPDLTNVKDQVAQFATMATNIDTSAVPRFANAAARAAAITSPTEGMMAYLGQESILTYYNGSDWQVADTARTIRKVNPETVTSAVTTMNADDVMYFYAEANSTYAFELQSAVSGDNTIDAMKSAWTGPTGATAVRNILTMASGQTNRNNTRLSLRSVGMTTVITTGTHSSAGIAFGYNERGTFTTSSTPGIIQWTWGKPTAYSATLTVSGSSYLSYRKIS